jgi:hypothetical protein
VDGFLLRTSNSSSIFFKSNSLVTGRLFIRLNESRAFLIVPLTLLKDPRTLLTEARNVFWGWTTESRTLVTDWRTDLWGWRNSTSGLLLLVCTAQHLTNKQNKTKPAIEQSTTAHQYIWK